MTRTFNIMYIYKDIYKCVHTHTHTHTHTHIYVYLYRYILYRIYLCYTIDALTDTSCDLPLLLIVDAAFNFLHAVAEAFTF